VNNAASADTLHVNAAGQLVRSATGRGGNWYRLAYSNTSTGALSSISGTSNTWSGAKSRSFGCNATGALTSLTTWSGTTLVRVG
jgi:hypothetical protein